MPDLRLFVEGFVVAAVVGLLVTRVLIGPRSGPAAAAWAGRGGAWLGAMAGLAAGWYRLGYASPWPPATGLDRLLTLVLPATAVLDLILSRGGLSAEPMVQPSGLWGPVPTRGGGIGLGLFSLAVPVILLWKSVHLDWVGRGEVPPPTSLMLLASGVVLGLGCRSLLRLSARCSDAMVPAGISAAVFTSGLCVLLAGYIKGGAVAFPLVGSLLGCLAAISPWTGLTPLTGVMRANARHAVTVAGLIALYGVLFVGFAFGKLTGSRGLLVGLAPLAGWIVELPLVSSFSRSWRIVVGLLSIALFLAMALVAAGLDFERSLGPLVR